MLKLSTLCSRMNFVNRGYLSLVSSVVNNIKLYSTKVPSVRIVEVGPRDGLQNESFIVPVEAKIEFINKLSETGLKTIEVASFVSAKWVPQMGDNTQVFSGIEKRPNISYPVLVPNITGLNSALTVGVQEIAVFVSASESFSKKNINCSMHEALNRVKVVVDAAKEKNLKIRGYVSCVVGCPYEGKIDTSAVSKTVSALLDLGCYEISLGDTIGVGTKDTITAMLKDVLNVTSPDKLALHCHDTYGQALPNICTALDYGLSVFDSSVSGLGGCPYARGASGNVATEDLIYMLHGMGIETGVDLTKVMEAGNYICGIINKPTGSKVNKALYKKL